MNFNKNAGIRLPKIKGALVGLSEKKSNKIDRKVIRGNDYEKNYSSYTGGSIKQLTSDYSVAKPITRSIDSRSKLLSRMDPVENQYQNHIASLHLRQEAYKRTLIRSLHNSSMLNPIIENARISANALNPIKNRRRLDNMPIQQKQISLLMTPQPNKIKQLSSKAPKEDRKVAISIADLRVKPSEQRYVPSTAVVNEPPKYEAFEAERPQGSAPDLGLSRAETPATRQKIISSPQTDIRGKKQYEQSPDLSSRNSKHQVRSMQAMRIGLQSGGSQIKMSRGSNRYAHVKSRLGIPSLSTLSRVESQRSGSDNRSPAKVNLQSLIDREIIMNALTTDFDKGESLYEPASHLYAIAIEQDVVADQPKLSGVNNNKNEELESIFEQSEKDLPNQIDLNSFRNPVENFISDDRSLRILVVASKLQLIVCKLCIYFDGALSRERLTGYVQIAPLIKNLLSYIMHSHLVLCLTTFIRLPDNAKETNKWAQFLHEVIENCFKKKLFDQIKQDGITKAIQMIRCDNENACAVIKTILTKFTYRQGVFETLQLTMVYLNKISLPTLVKLLDEGNHATYEEIESNIKGIIRPMQMQAQYQMIQPKAKVVKNPKKHRSSKPFKNEISNSLFGVKKSKKMTAQQSQLFSLPRVCEPFLPPLKPFEQESNYTLVLDLDETLIHYMEDQDESYFLTRPFCQRFLTKMSKYYEIVIFTAGMKEYADWVIDQLDPTGKLVKYRLYREHTINRDMTSDLPLIIKDLSKLGRDLSKTIIVDNIAENFVLQKDSGIFISTWYDDQEDRALFDLIPLLTQLVQLQVKDVRNSLQKFRDQMGRMIQQGKHKKATQALPI